jgi:hypothetical protein
VRDADVAARLRIPATGRGMTHCPGHDDRHRSLSWTWSNGRLLLYCFAGCGYEAILDAVPPLPHARPSRFG